VETLFDKFILRIYQCLPFIIRFFAARFSTFFFTRRFEQSKFTTSNRNAIIEGVSKRALQLRKLIYIYSQNTYSILICYNVAKDAEFYQRPLRFNVTSTGNSGCFKYSFTSLKAYINLFGGHVQCFELP
jgi:hypothetical protein